MVHLLYGRAGCGKSAVLFARIYARAQEGKRSFLLVPETNSHDATRGLLAACGNAAGLYAEVVTFHQLMQRAFSEAGGLAMQVLSDSARMLAMARAVRAQRPALKHYTALSRDAAFYTEALSFVDECKSCRTPPAALSAAAERTEGSLSDKLGDLAVLYAAYERVVAQSGVDPRDRMTILAEKLPECTFLRGAHVYVDGFTGFTPQELAVLGAMLRAGAEMTVALTCDALEGGDEDGVFSKARRTARRLRRVAARCDAAVTAERLERAQARASELMYLEQALFSYDAAPFEGACPALSVYAAGDMFTECERAASEILRMVREEGRRFRAFGVCARNIDDYAATIETVFERYGVPVFISGKRDITKKPVVAVITSALEVMRRGFSHETMMPYLRTYLAGLTPDECDVLENYALLWNLRGAMWTRETPLTMSPDGFTDRRAPDETERLEAVNALRLRAARPLARLQEAFRAARLGGEYLTALYAFFEEIGLYGAIERRAAECGAQGETVLAAEYVQLWEMIVSVLEDFMAVSREQEMDTEEFASMLTLALGTCDVGTIPMTVDHVLAYSLDTQGDDEARVLFVLGANEGSLPKIITPSGLLTDYEREELLELDMELNPPSSRLALEEQGLIYLAFSAARDALFLSYVTRAASGEERRASYLVARMRRLFPQMRVEAERADMPFRMLAAQPACDELLARGADVGHIPELRRAAERGRAASDDPRGPIGSRETARALYGGAALTLTASRLDRFYSCKFAYFMEYGLRAKRRRTASFEAPEAGTFLHFVLERALSALGAAEGALTARTPGEIRDAVRAAVDAYVTSSLGDLQEKSARFRHLFARLCRAVEEIVLDVVEELKQSDFRPLDFELDFSPGGDVEPMALDLNGDEVRVIGKVDRVDGYIRDGALYLRVVDYKSGKKKFSLTDLWNGLSMQMLIYLFTLEKAGLKRYQALDGGVRAVLPAGVLYVPAREGYVDALPSDGEAVIARLRERETRRSGLVLNDSNIISAMEHALHPEEGKSVSGRYIPVSFDRQGEVSAASSMASLRQFAKLRERIERLVRGMAEEVLAGGMEATPYRAGDGRCPCDWCDYKYACQFDESVPRDQKRWLYTIAREEFWKRLGETGEGEEHV